MTEITDQSEYRELVGYISSTYTLGRQRAIQAVNASLLDAYWQIGQHIVEFEQGGAAKARYGTKLLPVLSKDLSLLHGKGFSLSNLKLMRNFYITYPKGQTLSGFLSWSHYVELLIIDDEKERQFYEQQTIAQNWSIREFKRQKKASLYLRVALSKDKKETLKSVKRNPVVFRPEDVVRDSYVLDFLKIPEPHDYTETELEQRIIDHLQQFLLEL